MQGLLHTVLAGANVGIFVLATMAFIVRLVLGKRESEWAIAADRVLFVAVVVGVGLAVLTGLSGAFGTWPQAAVRTTLLTQNKILATVALLSAWGMFALMRWRFGTALWQSLPLKAWSAVLVAIGFVNVVLVGSMGGSAALKGTLLDPLFWSLNINRFSSLAWTTGINIGVIAVVLVLIVATSVMRLRTR